MKIATMAIIIVVIANSFSKAFIAMMVGRRDVGMYVLGILVITGISGILGAWFLV